MFSKKPPAPAEEIEAAKKKTEELTERYHREMQAMTVYNVFNPEVDLEAIPRLWIESIEVEGPIADWPPKGRTELFFDGEAADDRQPIHPRDLRPLSAAGLSPAGRAGKRSTRWSPGCSRLKK